MNEITSTEWLAQFRVRHSPNYLPEEAQEVTLSDVVTALGKVEFDAQFAYLTLLTTAHQLKMAAAQAAAEASTSILATTLQREAEDLITLVQQNSIGRGAYARWLERDQVIMQHQLDKPQTRVQGDPPSHDTISALGQQMKGLLLVRANIWAIGLEQISDVAIYVIYHDEMFLITTGNVEEATAWLGSDAQRIIQWNHTGMNDSLSGIWFKPSFEVPTWVKDWSAIQSAQRPT